MESQAGSYFTGAESAQGPLVPIREYAWTDDYSYLRVLTCKNHTTARYYTKNPFTRSLHVIKFPAGDIERSSTGECVCPFSDLVVIVDQSNDPRKGE